VKTGSIFVPTLSKQTGNWRPSIGLAVLCFYSKARFWSSYCQISTDLDKIWHTPIVIRNTLVGRLRLQSARGRLQAKPERLCLFVILVIRRGSPRFRRQTVKVEVRTDWCYRDFVKNSGIFRVGGARSETSFFAFFMETVLPQTNDIDGKPRLWSCTLC